MKPPINEDAQLILEIYHDPHKAQSLDKEKKEQLQIVIKSVEKKLIENTLENKNKVKIITKSIDSLTFIVQTVALSIAVSTLIGYFTQTTLYLPALGTILGTLLGIGILMLSKISNKRHHPSL